MLDIVYVSQKCNLTYRSGQKMFEKYPKIKNWIRTFTQLFLAILIYLVAVIVVSRLVIPLVLLVVNLNEIQLYVMKGFISLVFISLGYFTYVKYYEKRQAIELAFNGRDMLWGVLAGIVIISVTSLSLFSLGYYRVETSQPLDEIFLVLVALMAQAITSEILFRGIFYRVLEQRIGTPYSILFVSVSIGLLNILNDGLNVMVLTTTILIQALWCSIYVLSRNVWVVGLSSAGWLCAIFMTGILDEHWRTSSPIVSSYTGPDFISGGVFGPEASIITIFTVSISLLVIWKIIYRNNAQKNTSLSELPKSVRGDYS